MDQEALQSVLEEGGLSGYQADVFVSLLWLEEATVSQLLDSCSVPQPRIYDVIDELESEGYIETYEEESTRARIHDPSIIQTELTEQADRLESAAERIGTVWEEPPFGRHEISVLSDFDHVVDHAASSIRNAENSVQLSLDVRVYVDLIDELRRAKDNGVHVELSLEETESFRFGVDDVDEYFETTASEVKRRHSTAPFIALIDSREVYFGLRQRPVDSYGLVINDQAMSSMLYWFYQNSLWEIWETVHSDSTDRRAAEYTEIRRCIRDATTRLEADETVAATVYGYDSEQGRQREVSGEVTDVVSPSDPGDADIQSDVFTGRATVFLDTGDAEYSVGGFGAILEDIRATRIVLHEGPAAE
ncbi:TrmB family transcriptional regulator sugar-binding domain-containing protein [Haloarcula litorea]|uniref:TrmB family transcriptional regulator sugar-binding domain-containing protein n=1 Tax=Haloarcula litorea TaxID=3032579 RepID=UPI0023E87C10|nr:TrmB family transcriptional regulator sugar-binding domain-containing protein [Halomicroarcula sp. GDY20]